MGIGKGISRALRDTHHSVPAQHLLIHLLQVIVYMRAHRIILIEMLFPTLRPYRETRILRYELKGIQPETIDTLIRPKSHDIVYFIAHPRVLPVQIRLLD